VNSHRRFPGLRALVTGASSGIGAAVSRTLVGLGAAVVGTGRDAGALQRLPGLAGCVPCDLTQPGAPAEVVAAAVTALGGLDLVVSSAGSGWAGPFEALPAEDLDRLVDLNLRAPMHLARAAGPHLRHSPVGGQLVLMGSIAGLVGVAQEVAYGTAKAGLKGLADGLRAEWDGPRRLFARDGTGPVTVTLVSPGPVDTAFFAHRNKPYARTWPKPAPVDMVATCIIDAIEHRRQDVVIPTWLVPAARLNGGLPSVYRLLQRATGRLAH
jgi:uncharacterized protein